jgi:hypothetical protein
MTRRPTIYEALRARLEREPTHAEQCAEVRRILAEGFRERAERAAREQDAALRRWRS